MKWLKRLFFCKHSYRITFFRAPHRDLLNLTCVHCEQELIFLLAERV